MELNRHDALANEVEVIGFFAFPEEKFACLESNIYRAANQVLEVSLV
jgi:hypothetical protein